MGSTFVFQKAHTSSAMRLQPTGSHIVKALDGSAMRIFWYCPVAVLKRFLRVLLTPPIYSLLASPGPKRRSG